MTRLDDLFRRNEGLGDFSDLRNGGNLRPRRRGLPWGAVLVIGFLILFVAFAFVMAPRVVAQTEACRPECAVAR